MTGRFIRSAIWFFAVFVVALLAIALFAFARAQGWLSPLGIDSESRDSQVITAIEKTEEVSLLSLKVQGLKEERRNSEVFGRSIPGTGEEVLLQYNFAAKLGLDNTATSVTQTGENSYLISVPAFKFIGYDEPTFKVIVEGGGVLRAITPDIDQVEVVNDILGDGARETYLDDNRGILEDQTRAFYDGLFASIDPALKTSYKFAS